MPRSRAALVLFLSILGISIAAPLVRLSHAHPVVIALWRLGFSLIVIAGMLTATGGWKQVVSLSRREYLIALGAGIMLAIHFAVWNTSVGLTTVAASVVLVNLQPAIVAVLSAIWLHESPSPAQRIGIGIAIAGAVVVAGSDAWAPGAFHGRALLGDLLAFIGGIAAAIYYTSGRRLRERIDLWPYVAVVYGACFVALLVIVLVMGAPIGPQPPRELAIFAALALGPMLLGHTGMNWAMRYLPAYVVSLTVLGEPVGATLIAALLPGIREIPGIATLVGGALIVAGILIAGRNAK